MGAGKPISLGFHDPEWDWKVKVRWLAQVGLRRQQEIKNKIMNELRKLRVAKNDAYGLSWYKRTIYRARGLGTIGLRL